ncbi:MAG: FAD:protein FMN transferase, partial [Rhodobiaceae bacterium]|nr:FAD:protein FMN transferase [Rhodobiaceae bacterium]
TSLTIAGRPRAEAERLIAAARAEIERLEQLFSVYRADSALVRLNSTGRLAGPHADMLALFSTVDAIHAATGGAFDPTVQPVWSLVAEASGRPDRSALDKALENVGWAHVRHDIAEIAFSRPGMAITLNGIAQGYATDRVAAFLKAAGLGNVLVSVGEIAAIGERTAGEPWRVGLAENAGGVAEETLPLCDMAVATSAPYATRLDADGAVGHILDPRRGPVASDWRRISVVHPSAAIADGLSTAFALLLNEQIAEIAGGFGARVIGVNRAGDRFAA